MKKTKKIILMSFLLLLMVQKTKAMVQDEDDHSLVKSNIQRINSHKEKKHDNASKALSTNVVTPAVETREKDANANSTLCIPSQNENKDELFTPLSLTFSSLATIVPGVYETDDIELILSYPLMHFAHQDLVIFDVDQVLLAAMDPYYFEHFEKKSPLNNRLFSQNKNIIEKFFLYMFVAHPWRVMDERTSLLIERLQSQKINCIANTAIHPTVNPNLNIDAPSLRIQKLREFNISFSSTFTELPLWDFDTLEAKHIAKDTPLFKEGVIFSSETPKSVTTLELFKKLSIKPKKVVYIDDILENSHKMYEALSEHGIECYSFVYSKKKTTSLQRSFFPDDIFNRELQKIETFLEQLLEGKNVDSFFMKIEKE